MSARDRILAAVSHDLKTPITRLRLRTELLDESPLRDKFQADLDDMQRMAQEIFREDNCSELIYLSKE